MFEAVAAALRADQHLGDARLAAEQIGHLGGQFLVAVGHEDVRKLVIDHRKRPAVLEIELLAVVRLANGQQARLAQECGSDTSRDRPA